MIVAKIALDFRKFSSSDKPKLADASSQARYRLEIVVDRAVDPNVTQRVVGDLIDDSAISIVAEEVSYCLPDSVRRGAGLAGLSECINVRAGHDLVSIGTTWRQCTLSVRNRA